MELKIKGLRILIDKNKNLGFCMKNEAVKEFCEYHKIPYEESNGGAVTTIRAACHSSMLSVFWKIVTNNNWRKMHHLPMVRRKGKRK